MIYETRVYVGTSGNSAFFGPTLASLALPSLSVSIFLAYKLAVPDLSVTVAGLKLANPTLTCSGTCGYAFEYADFLDLSKLGVFVTKSITREQRKGNEPA